jgi:hypothetical protein
VNITRVVAWGVGIYAGTIRVIDPASHLETTTLVLTPSLTRTGTGGVSGIGFGLFYILNWTL